LRYLHDHDRISQQKISKSLVAELDSRYSTRSTASVGLTYNRYILLQDQFNEPRLKHLWSV
jgi:hypothetical protein